MTEERTIVFTGMTGRIDVPSFVLTENSDLRIKLDFAGMKSKSGLFRMFVQHGGAPTYTFAFTQKEPYVTLPAPWLKRGGTEYIEFSLKQYNDAGTVLINGGYVIEPLSVMSEDGNFVVTSVIQRLTEQVEELKAEVREAFEEHKGAVASELEQIKAGLEENLSTIHEETESFKSGVSGEIETIRTETSVRLAETDEKLSQALGTLNEVLAKMKDYADNGAEVTF